MGFKKVLLLLVLVLVCTGAEAQRYRRDPAFTVPEELRPRVGFWIDVFTRYGEHHAVLHHREYPQAVFKILDFRRAAAELNDVQLERFKKQQIKKSTFEILEALRILARGSTPGSDLEIAVEEAMQLVPGGRQKYSDAVNKGLVRSQTGIREKYEQALIRSGRYIDLIEDIFVNNHRLPVELTRLPFVESSFDYRAYSSVGAAGIWQFMRRTAKVFSLTINNAVDERRDIVESTNAAARYLRQAYEQLGNWPLALTSYNHGVAGVSRKVRSFGTRDISALIERQGEKPFGFASSNFYPEFLAALEIYDNPRRYFPDIEIETPYRIAQVQISVATSVAHVEKQLGIDRDTLKSYNYALAPAVWKGALRIPAGYVLKVPADYSTRLAALRVPEGRAQPVLPGTSSIYGGATYKVRRGDSLFSIAKKYGVSTAEIMRLNNLSSDQVQIGQLLVVKAKENEPAAVTQSAAKIQKKKIHVVRKGDTLWSIARQYDVSLSKLKAVNKIKKSALRVGQKLEVPQG